MPEPTPTARDMAAARDAVRSTWSRSREVTEEVVAQAIATARAEGFAAGAAKEREACAKVAAEYSPTPDERRRLREAGSANDVWDGIEYACENIATAIRQGAPHAE